MTDIFTPNPPPALPLNPTPEKNGRRGKRGPRRANPPQAGKTAKPPKQRRARRAPTDRHVVQETPISQPNTDTWTNSEVALLMRINSLLEQNNAADRKKILKALMPL